jgi:hypothetical protein
MWQLWGGSAGNLRDLGRRICIARNLLLKRVLPATSFAIKAIFYSQNVSSTHFSTNLTPLPAAKNSSSFEFYVSITQCTHMPYLKHTWLLRG